MMHYAYTSTYVWMVLTAHYIFRAFAKGLLAPGHLMMSAYSGIGWGTHAAPCTPYRVCAGVPLVWVIIFCGIDISRYGISDRCYGAFNGSYFMWAAYYLMLILNSAVGVNPYSLLSTHSGSHCICRDGLFKEVHEQGEGSS
jgi:hypothetical protein